MLAFDDGPLHRELAARGVPVVVEHVPGGRSKIPAAAAAVSRAVQDIRPAVISGHHILAESSIRLATRGDRIPNIAWKHTYGHIGHRGLRERVFEGLTGRAVTRYGAVCHTQVRYLTDQLGLSPEKISVVPNAVPVPAERPDRPPAGPPIVLMTAALRADKDHSLVLRAWPLVLSRYPHAVLQFAGAGPCRSDLERQAARLGISGSVQFLGVRSDVDSLLARAHLLVLASYAVECFPYAVLEAMAAGRGVVSTNVAGLPELVDDGFTGRLVPTRDSAALGSAIIEGLTDAAGNDPGWGAAGWTRARQVYPLDRWTDQITGLFEELAA